MLPGVGGKEKGELFNGPRVFVWDDEKSLDIDSSDGYTRSGYLASGPGRSASLRRVSSGGGSPNSLPAGSVLPESAWADITEYHRLGGA